MYQKLFQNKGMYWKLFQNEGIYWKLFDTENSRTVTEHGQLATRPMLNL